MPKIQLPHKLKKILTTKARLIVLVGGRSSAKSESVGRFLLMRCQTEGADVLCGREFQTSIDDSVHKLLKNLIKKIPIHGFSVTDKKIDCITDGAIRFKGFARNPEAVKSAQDFKYSWMEEAQTASQPTIDDLLPTIRAKGSQLIFTANPQASGDPFSKRFIVPYLRELKTNGYYEDDLHLIIMCNWRDNPWHGELESQRKWDYDHLPRAKYDWIWEGAFNDSVEDPLILAEWFDSCIDSHKKLGFKAIGSRISTHDPSDVGPDAKAYSFRHGSVFLQFDEMIDGDINQGCDWATGKTIQNQSDTFTWDIGGMGTGLKRQVAQSFQGKNMLISMFDGSKGVDNPDAIFDPVSLDISIQDQKVIKDCIKNRRAQYYFDLRQCIYRTFEAINGAYHDPDTLISFDSKIKLLPKLRSELCRMPIKPNRNGLFELYTKEELKNKFKFDSPNLSDCAMMSRRVPKRFINNEYTRPTPIKPKGRRRR